jgi:hypothetical protein
MQIPAQAEPAVTMQAPRQAVLHLRGATREEEAESEGERRSIRWAEDVVDNEGLGRKSSKGLFPLCFLFGVVKRFWGRWLMGTSVLHIPRSQGNR